MNDTIYDQIAAWPLPAKIIAGIILLKTLVLAVYSFYTDGWKETDGRL